MTGEPVVGVFRGRWSRALPTALLDACARVGVAALELPGDDVHVVVDRSGVARVPGAERVTHLAPAVMHLQPWLQVAAAAIEHGGAVALNPVVAAAMADDKAATAVALAAAGVAQVPTVVASDDPAVVAAAAAGIGYPIVVKRTHGAQGRWVRKVEEPGRLPAALLELAEDGPSALVLQPFITGAAGRTTRAIVTGAAVLAATERSAEIGDFRSNVHLGGQQRAVALDPEQRGLAVAAAGALGLGHAGVDLIHTPGGPAVLEVNACPDFTSMRPHTPADLAAAVIDELLRLRG